MAQPQMQQMAQPQMQQQGQQVAGQPSPEEVQKAWEKYYADMAAYQNGMQQVPGQ